MKNWINWVLQFLIFYGSLFLIAFLVSELTRYLGHKVDVMTLILIFVILGRIFLHFYRKDGY